jgi:hypothetical protein
MDLQRRGKKAESAAQEVVEQPSHAMPPPRQREDCHLNESGWQKADLP